MKLLDENGNVKEFVNGKYPAKVLNISHTDLDGVTSAISIANTFTEVETIYTTYGWNMDKLFAKWDAAPTVFQKYDLVIFTDVSMDMDKMKKLLNLFQVGQYQGEFAFLDHHEGSKELHNPANNWLVIENVSGSLLTQRWCQTTFKVDLSFLDQLVKYTNDYDLWIHKHKESKQLQYLLDAEFKKDKDNALYNFGEKYMNGIDFTNLTTEEQDIIKWKENYLDDSWDKLEVDQFPGTRVALIMVDGGLVNEMCERLLNDKSFGIDFVINFPLNRTGGSIRANAIGNMNVNDFLKIVGKHLGIAGGGHKLAAGFAFNDMHWKMTAEDKIKMAQPILNKMVGLLTKTYSGLVEF